MLGIVKRCVYKEGAYSIPSFQFQAASVTNKDYSYVKTFGIATLVHVALTSTKHVFRLELSVLEINVS